MHFKVPAPQGRTAILYYMNFLKGWYEFLTDSQLHFCIPFHLPFTVLLIQLRISFELHFLSAGFNITLWKSA